MKLSDNFNKSEFKMNYVNILLIQCSGIKHEHATLLKCLYRTIPLTTSQTKLEPSEAIVVESQPETKALKTQYQI